MSWTDADNFGQAMSTSSTGDDMHNDVHVSLLQRSSSQPCSFCFRLLFESSFLWLGRLFLSSRGFCKRVPAVLHIPKSLCVLMDFVLLIGLDSLRSDIHICASADKVASFFDLACRAH